jgi:hypothetical protein
MTRKSQAEDGLAPASKVEALASIVGPGERPTI